MGIYVLHRSEVTVSGQIVGATDDVYDAVDIYLKHDDAENPVAVSVCIGGGDTVTPGALDRQFMDLLAAKRKAST